MEETTPNEESSSSQSQEITEVASETPETKDVSGSSPIEDSGTEISTAYTPNLKFKVMDQEKSIDDFLAPIIKDSDTEKKVRELYEKAYGLDFVKPKYEDLKSKYSTVEQTHNQLVQDVQTVLQYKDKGDLDRFFETVGLSEDKVAEWILEKAKKLNLPPEQRQVYDQFDQTRRQNDDLQRQLQAFEAHNQQFAVQARTQELESVLTRPEVSSMAANYDAARQQAGAFKDLVVNLGLMEFHKTGRDISAEQAALQAMSLLGNAYQRSNGVQTPGTSSERELPVIPRVGGKGVSPAGKQPRSIEDLKKMRAEMTGA